MLEVEIAAAPEALAGLRRRLRAWLTEAGVGDQVATDALLAVGEAATNTVEHAYVDADGGTVIVSASLHGGELRLSVADTGTWQPPHDGDGSTRRGRGLEFIREVMGEVSVHTSSTGTRVHMLRQIEEADSP